MSVSGNLFNFTPLLMNKNLMLELFSVNGAFLSDTLSIRYSLECSDERRAAIEKQLDKDIHDCLKICDDFTGERLNREVTVKEVTLSRTITLFSIFFNLRNQLENEKKLVIIDKKNYEFNKIREGDIVELEGVIMENQPITTLKLLINILENIDKDFIKARFKELKTIINYDILLNSLKMCYEKCTEYNTRDLILNLNNKEVVLTANMDHLIDNHPYDILRGRCRILAKSIRVIREEEEINLFRRTGMVEYYNSFFKNIEGHLNIIRENGIVIPKINPVIKGPTIQVVPIAVYL
ncbi:DUF6414 family protein [Clostridium fallax]|uniref:Uncharacterized protein n=1 Tax=Clostridium fallax TaxID=1533 RepID=A0A1M4Y8J6_9CLOT|nr:hypothetical protein [Clostridium fallax]SHF01923.1 hypothetical protein SAMN05443638_1255 [Clostridium fallax]SQB06018.1 Uncharacterised protein [Clostridium fallax]